MGLGEIADAVHEEGCKFMVWFEPERVIKNSYWAYEHPKFDNCSESVCLRNSMRAWISNNQNVDVSS